MRWVHNKIIEGIPDLLILVFADVDADFTEAITIISVSLQKHTIKKLVNALQD